ncbi:MAG TPA: hypothetical protein VF457_14945, partial [Burkholderiaceae bacterium]
RFASVQFTDGETTDVRAGQLVDVYVGGEWRAPRSPLAVQVTAGYHFDNVGARNGSIRFERFPFEATALWRLAPAWRLGVGARYSAGARLHSSGVTDIGDYDFKSSLGGLVMGEWLVTPHMGLQLRYVHETFRLDGISYDGSHGGVGFNYYF